MSYRRQLDLYGRDDEYDFDPEDEREAELERSCYRDEYQPWEDREWFTEGPGSMDDPRHSQGYARGKQIIANFISHMRAQP